MPGRTDDWLKLEVMNFSSNRPCSCICVYVGFQQFINWWTIMCYYKKKCSLIAPVLNFTQQMRQWVKGSVDMDKSVVKIMD